MIIATLIGRGNLLNLKTAERVLTESTSFNADQSFIAISLGRNCRIAVFLQKYLIRSRAFPFDWVVTSYQSIYDLIKNDFIGFMRKENLQPERAPNNVLDKGSGVVFVHDFRNNSQEEIDQNYDAQYAKFMRRIKYFYDAINSGKHIYFIRYLAMTKIQACEICNLLKNKFPDLAFTLIVIGDDPAEYSEDWKIPNIRNFFVKEDAHNFWQTHIEHPTFWKKLCEDIYSGVLKS